MSFTTITEAQISEYLEQIALKEYLGKHSTIPHQLETWIETNNFDHIKKVVKRCLVCDFSEQIIQVILDRFERIKQD